ncbi:MAG: hypothetical protein ABW178_11535 [Pseudoxanthomonas sp.]
MSSDAADVMKVLVADLAALIDGAQGQADAWLEDVPIAELGGRTAAELIAQGQGLAVLQFLLRVARQQRNPLRCTSSCCSFEIARRP